MARSLFPEVPKEEPPDPNVDRSLPSVYRSARRNLVAVCALCLAWSAAQFGPELSSLQVAGMAVDIKDASIPLLLGVLLTYFTVRWGLEFAMMPRFLRRWRLAQLDFRIVFLLARFSLAAIAAGALDRSLWTIAMVAIGIALLAFLSLVLSFVFAMVAMAVLTVLGRPSAATAANEAGIWGGLAAVLVAIAGVVYLGVASCHHEGLREAIWQTPPNPMALGVFLFALVLVFLSHWLLRPLMNVLFGIRPGYYTERQPDGSLHICTVRWEQEPLL